MYTVYSIHTRVISTRVDFFLIEEEKQEKEEQ
jgi:hypothetical protein